MSLFPKKHSQRKLFFLQINGHDDQYPSSSSSSSSTFLQPVPNTFPNPTTHPIHPPFNDGVHTRSLYSLYLLLLFTAVCILSIGIPLALLHYCRRRRTTTNPTNTRNLTAQETHEENHQVGLFSIPNWFFDGTAGLRQSQMNKLPVFGYGEDSGVIEGIEYCSVCLGQFEEGERLRLLPRCNHAFHVACIDTWLKSRNNCPLCRASIAGDGNGSRDPNYRVDDEESGGNGINNIRQEEGCEDSSSTASPERLSTMTVHAPADEAQITEMTNVKPKNNGGGRGPLV